MLENESTQSTNPKRARRSSQRKRPDSTQPSAVEPEKWVEKTRKIGRRPATRKQGLIQLGPWQTVSIWAIILCLCLVGFIAFIFAFIRDTTPPVIQKASFSDINEKSTTITWQTDEPATTQVKICSSDICTSTEPDKPLVVSHSATLTDLKPDTAYNFTLISRDKSGNEAKLEIELITAPPPYVPQPPISAVEIGPEIGKRAPDFTLPTLDGKQLSLSQFRGKKVMVNFWQSSCSACRTEIPYIQAVYDRWSRDDLEILAVSVGERTAFVQSFVDRQGLTFPVLLDSDEAVSKTYQISSYPTTVFINADGIIKKMKDGRFSDESEIEDMLNSL
jgi:peroxiredoxin